MTFCYHFNRVSILLITICYFAFSQIIYPSDAIANELPFCGQETSQERRLILVSTLDGKVSALNLDDGGTETWNIGTGPGPMLSSSIHRLELTNNGQWVRMIPSLSGGLYKFNGENIEAIPITAENLLRSSFRYSDDLVISGGKESRTYGVEVETGRVLYECSLGGCDNLTEAEVAGDVLIVQRQTQTVRAVEPRTGVERWNFSVGQHELKMSPGLLIGCHSTEPISDNILLKVIVPEGLVCAVSKTQPGQVLWSHKFDSPVVSAWKVGRGRMEAVDLFGGDLPLARQDHDPPFPNSPALYIGMHHKQLYIQESVMMQHKLHQLAEASFRYHLLTDEKKYPQIPWNPVHVTSTALGIAKQDHDSKLTHEESNQTTAIAVLYASEYVNGNGYYLYSKEESVSVCASDSANTDTITESNVTQNNSTDTEEPVDYVEPPDDNTVFTHNQIFVVTSLWFWWKEVFLISVTTAVVVNLVIQRRLFQGMNFYSTQIVFVKDSLKSFSSRDSGRESNSTLSTSSLPVALRSSDSFESRFLTDFIPVNCLGKGGFGVVFEAKNKIDDCHYAIKRIELPNSEESREKVMREVKALAKLDHHNIVRYFNAWLECPPPGWQETQDKKWKNCRDHVSSNGDAFTVDLTGQVTPDSERSFGNVINRNRLKPLSLLSSTNWKSELSEIPIKPEPPDDDSFIVFGSPSREVSKAESESNKCKASEDSGETADKLDSAITIASDTSRDTNTDVTDVDKSVSPKRPKSLSIKSSGDLAPGSVLNSSRMFLFIQMQLCKKKSLKDWLKDNVHNRPRPSVINMFDQIIQAVEYVHMQGLIHRDLKPSNIFFSPDGQVKVGDFGLVTAMAESPTDLWVSVDAELDTWGEVTDDRHTARVGTQLYMSPEQVAGKPYSYKVDIYSLGVILFELLVPFNTQMERIHTLTNLKANKYPDDFQTKFGQEYELLKMMLSHRPDDRPTTFGIRARPPLNCDSPLNVSVSDWHFDLPNRRRLSTSASRSSNNSASLD